MESSTAITENLTNELAAKKSIGQQRYPKFGRARMGSASHASYEVGVRRLHLAARLPRSGTACQPRDLRFLLTAADRSRSAGVTCVSTDDGGLPHMHRGLEIEGLERASQQRRPQHGELLSRRNRRTGENSM
jgi:hypothetical protein